MHRIRIEKSHEQSKIKIFGIAWIFTYNWYMNLITLSD